MSQTNKILAGQNVKVTANTADTAQTVYGWAPLGLDYDRLLFSVAFEDVDGNLVVETTENLTPKAYVDEDTVSAMVCKADTQKSVNVDEVLRTYWRIRLWAATATPSAPVSAYIAITGVKRA